MPGIKDKVVVITGASGIGEAAAVTLSEHGAKAVLGLEVCAAFPAITAVGKGLDAYVAVDASGTFSETKR